VKSIKTKKNEKLVMKEVTNKFKPVGSGSIQAKKSGMFKKTGGKGFNSCVR